MYGLGDLGSGVRVALYELEPNLPSDITAYKKCYGVSTSVSYHKVDGGAGSGAGSGEAALDIEDVLGLAPDVAIDVYQSPNTGAGALDNYAAIFNADTDAVVTTSWGVCELLESQSTVSSEQTLFAQANSQGETVFAAAGDDGSTDCYPGSDGSDISIDDPGSQPYVDGVGGTKLTSSAETVWNESSNGSGAGGGGVSEDWCMPSYQYQTTVPGLINSHSVKNTGCPAAEGTYVREDPDVTADADPFTGYVIYHGGSWTEIGGTSAAAPLWAAVAALIDDSPFCADYASGDVGVLPQALWGIASMDHPTSTPAAQMSRRSSRTSPRATTTTRGRGTPAASTPPPPATTWPAVSDLRWSAGSDRAGASACSIRGWPRPCAGGTPRS